MNFVYPAFLFALTAVSIPIIIHLFNFRRFKKVYFPDVRFLKEVKQQTRNRNRIKHLLVLLCRVLAVAFLVLAFAQPYLPADKTQTAAGTRAVSVYVDNSFSMENVSRSGMLLDEAKRTAREIALAHTQTDRFQLLTNDFEARHQRLVSREEFLTLLDEVASSPSVRLLSEVTSRQADVLSGTDSKNKKAFLLSDFQRSSSDLEKTTPDTSVKVVLIPLAANLQNNLYIDSCWFSSPVHQLDKPQELIVRIRNASDAGLENIPAKLFLNGQQRTPVSFSIQPGESKEITLSFTVKEPGIQQGRIEIADFPVTYDDKFYFSFSVAKNIAVTTITPSQAPSGSPEGSQPLSALFGKDSLFAFTTQEETRIDYSALTAQQLIVLAGLKNIPSGLAQELERFVQGGGSLVVFPSPDADTSSYRSFLSTVDANHFRHIDTADTKADRINMESDVFSDVFEKKTDNMDLPVVRSHFTLSNSVRTIEEALITLKNNDPLFARYTYKKGAVYLSAVPLDGSWSNLSKHAIFVPLMFKIAMNSRPAEELFYTAGQNVSIPCPAAKTGDNVYRIRGENTKGPFEVIPESRVVDMQPSIFVHDHIRQSGNYSLYSGSEAIAGLAFNYDRKESDLKVLNLEELQAFCENAAQGQFSLIDSTDKEVSKLLTDLAEGKKLWKWCILLALIFLAGEVALLRLYK